ncbi:hypothetical protein B0T20DRAFT_140063 [Sordaria brevicollis]|uniref:Uncharacterized protein n=1 Tax=Sordaria brevicollis TaxID=83679 RepID=A0AAE0NRB8_SORBR|nr:hypothetical protein B0T20DRAFT_140063 [Sordaria brevicollis]
MATMESFLVGLDKRDLHPLSLFSVPKVWTRSITNSTNLPTCLNLHLGTIEQECNLRQQLNIKTPADIITSPPVMSLPAAAAPAPVEGAASPSSWWQLQQWQPGPIDQIPVPELHKLSHNGTPPRQGPLGDVMDMQLLNLKLYQLQATLRGGTLDARTLFEMAENCEKELEAANGFVPVRVEDYVYLETEERMGSLQDQLMFFEFQCTQWALFQAYRQEHLRRDMNRQELCVAYYRWLLEPLEHYWRVAPYEPRRIGAMTWSWTLCHQLRFVKEFFYDEDRYIPSPDAINAMIFDGGPTPPQSSSPLPAVAPATKAPEAIAPQSSPLAPGPQLPQPADPDALPAPSAPPQPPRDPAAPSNSNRSPDGNDATSVVHQQPARPAKRKRATLSRELRSLAQLGGPGNAVVGLGVDNDDNREHLRRLRRKTHRRAPQ